MAISSSHNPFLKKVRQAAEAGKPLEDGSVIAEGPHLVAEVLASPWKVKQVLITPESVDRFPALVSQLSSRNEIEVTTVGARAFQAMASTEHSQGVVALAQPRLWKWRDLQSNSGPIVILDGIQDPGNAGTIVRSAEAFGAAGVVFLEGSVRVANNKILRAAAGSLFRLPFLERVRSEEVIQEVRQSGIKLYALAANRQNGLHPLGSGGKIALIIGNEGAGVRPELLESAEHLSIPTSKVESLNAAVACSIVLFEWSRRGGEL